MSSLADRGGEAARQRFPVVVVGGGQSGLAMSRVLGDRGIGHVVLERHRLGHAWRDQRWDSFCLVTPNWQCRLPGFDYPGDDPDGFMVKDDIVRYIEAYAASFAPPLREGVEVRRLTRGEGGGYELETSDGPYAADQVVVAVGGYHVPVVPRLAERLDPGVAQVHASAYRGPYALPEGGVLVVGTGQSGCQIAEDLHLAGRQVHLAVGSAPRTARRYRGRDVVAWLHDLGYYDMPVEEHPLKERVRAKANHYVTGRDGGRDIDLRQRALEGMRLYGRLEGIDGGVVRFGDGLGRDLDNADMVAEGIKDTIDKFIRRSGAEASAEERYRPVWEPGAPVRELGLRAAGVRAVVWSTGYRHDFGWIEVPVFDGRGYPGHRRGVTAADGLYFLGLPWLHTWGSGRFSGVGRDAGHLAERIEARHRSGTSGRALAGLNEAALGS